MANRLASQIPPAILQAHYISCQWLLWPLPICVAGLQDFPGIDKHHHHFPTTNLAFARGPSRTSMLVARSTWSCSLKVKATSHTAAVRERDLSQCPLVAAEAWFGGGRDACDYKAWPNRALPGLVTIASTLSGGLRSVVQGMSDSLTRSPHHMASCALCKYADRAWACSGHPIHFTVRSAFLR